MADYYTQFSCIFPVGTTENATHAVDIFHELSDPIWENEDPVTFDASIDETDPTQLWLRNDEHGVPEQVVAFVLRCADELDLTGQWEFCWSLTCSKPRLDGFGGGAQIIDLGARSATEWIDCSTWLAQGMAAPQS